VSEVSLPRRQFLNQALCLLVFGAAWGCTQQDADTEPAAIHGDWLDIITPDVAAAARLGQAYLDAHPQEAEHDALYNRVMSTLQGHAGFTGAQTDGERFAAIATVVSEDYVAGDTVLAAGWVLSRTEARIYALLALR